VKAALAKSFVAERDAVCLTTKHSSPRADGNSSNAPLRSRRSRARLPESARSADRLSASAVTNTNAGYAGPRRGDLMLRSATSGAALPWQAGVTQDSSRVRLRTARRESSSPRLETHPRSRFGCDLRRLIPGSAAWPSVAPGVRGTTTRTAEPLQFTSSWGTQSRTPKPHAARSKPTPISLRNRTGVTC